MLALQKSEHNSSFNQIMNLIPNASHIVTTRDMNVGIIIYVNCLNEANRNNNLNRVSNEIKNKYGE
jgi:hypothetical protein